MNPLSILVRLSFHAQIEAESLPLLTPSIIEKLQFAFFSSPPPLDLLPPTSLPLLFCCFTGRHLEKERHECIQQHRVCLVDMPCLHIRQ